MSALHLIPVPIEEDASEERAQAHLSAETLSTLRALRFFLVETPKAARLWLKRLGHPAPMQSLTITAIPDGDAALASALAPLQAGIAMGVLSDAGCPGVADPGARVARLAHRWHIPVIPHVGPSSILLALMGSGLEGQRFRFEGYLPVAEEERSTALKSLEKESQKHGCSVLFIETPYRNQALWSTLLSVLKPKTLLTLAVHLTGQDASIRTQTVAEWKKSGAFDLQKRPTLFALLAQ